MIDQPELGQVSISDQANIYGTWLHQWAQPLGGSVLIVYNMRHLWEKIAEHSQQKDRAPLILICFNGERSRGSEQLRNSLHRVDRDWIVVVLRGHGFESRPSKDRSTQTDDFYTDCETIRDRIRMVRSGMAEFPCDYKGMQPLPGVAIPNIANVFVDAYQIMFVTANDIKAVGIAPPTPSEEEQEQEL